MPKNPRWKVKVKHKPTGKIRVYTVSAPTQSQAEEIVRNRSMNPSDYKCR